MNRSSLGEESAFKRDGAAWSEITRLGEAAFRFRIGGPFRGAWLAVLTARLAEQHVSIDHTHARLSGDEIWIAEFHLLALPGAPDLSTLDYVALADGARVVELGAFELESYRLIESRDYGTSLVLTLEAQDSLGLLGSLLVAFAELGLYPRELHIETRGGRAYDSLWFAGVGGTPPDPAARDAAEALLARSLKIAS